MRAGHARPGRLQRRRGWQRGPPDGDRVAVGHPHPPQPDPFRGGAVPDRHHAGPRDDLPGARDAHPHARAHVAAADPAADPAAVPQPPKQPSQPPSTRVSTVIAVPVPSSKPPEASPSSSPTPVTAAEDTTEDTSVSTAAWILIALLVLAAAIGTWLFLRSRKRRAWLSELEAAQAEVSWFARDLVPQLRASGSAERVAGGWQVAVPRVVAAENRLTVLESSAPGQEDASRARQLRDAVRVATNRMEAMSSPGPHDEWALDLDDVQALLVAALGPVPVDEPGEKR